MHAIARRAPVSCPTLRFYPFASLRSSAHSLSRLQKRSFHISLPRTRQPNSDDDAADNTKPEESGSSLSVASHVNEGAPQPSTAAAEDSEPSHRAQRRRPGSVGRRVVNAKPPQELPPVNLPEEFLKNDVTIFGEPDPISSFIRSINRNVQNWDTLQGSLADIFLLDLLSAGGRWAERADRVLGRALEAVAWNDELVKQALDGDLESIERRGDLIVGLCRIRTQASAHRLGHHDRFGLFKAREAILRPRLREAAYGWETSLLIETCSFLSAARQSLSLLSFKSILQSLCADLISQDMPPHYMLPWLHMSAYQNLRDAVAGEFALEPSPKVQLMRDAKRPVTLFTIPDYNGKIFAKAAVTAVATSLGADVVHLDARSLSIVVGEYLGQDWVYSRGPISTLGFKVAEINGRIGRHPELSGLAPLQPDESDEGTVVSLHAAELEPEKSPMDRELQKIRSGARDYILPSVDRWDNLKINAALERLVDIAGTEAKADRKLLIHVDDFVELNMTLEGSLLLGRLRSIVDTAWQNGQRIALVGTSSFDNPSEQFLATLADLAVEECHISSPLLWEELTFWGFSTSNYLQMLKERMGNSQNSGSPKSTLNSPPPSQPVLGIDSHPRSSSFQDFKAELEQFEYRIETIANVRHVLRNMNPDAAARIDDLPPHMTMDRIVPLFKFLKRRGGRKRSNDAESSQGPDVAATEDVGPRESTWPKSVYPLPIVYDVARKFSQSFKTHCSSPGFPGTSGWDVLQGLLHRYDAWLPLQNSEQPAQEPSYEQADSNVKSQRRGGKKADADSQHNEYEKKLIPGLIKSDMIRTTFGDVHLPTETISTVRLLTTLSLIRPDALSYGILAKERMPGCLLYGPPGTGKTLLAKAVAKESGANVLEVTGASIEDMYVGESEKNVRALFSLAKKMSPMIIFIDEADSLLGSRSMPRVRPSRRETLNQFLREWDGMTETNALIMVATNRPYDLDDAILRRLPRKILVDLPLQSDRASILRIFLKDEVLDDTVSIDQLSHQTPFYSGSDLKNLCVAAAMAAVREENEEAAKHSGAGKHVYPARRTLRRRHFDQALREVTASTSADMPSLKAIRKFDELYGKPAGSKKAKSMGFGVIPPVQDSDAARVRTPEPSRA